MRNLKFTVTAAQLNALTPVVVDVVLSETTYTPTGASTVANYYPLQLYIPNNSGTDIEFNTFESLEEYNEYVADPTNFQFLPVLNGNALSNSDVPQLYRVLVQGVTATAVQDLTIYCINYQDIRGN
jgi:hypothetical protein